jgi:hypothetical protein
MLPGDVPKGTLRTIIHQMQISVEEFNAFISLWDGDEATDMDRAHLL